MAIKIVEYSSWIVTSKAWGMNENEWKFVNQTTHYMHDKTPVHASKLEKLFSKTCQNLLFVTGFP